MPPTINDQAMSTYPPNEVLPFLGYPKPAPFLSQETKPRPQPPHPQEEPLRCPRCNSLNTKFCYYNNYSLTQPRYFCKSCRRYWTKGGTLRNVPVGGGCRKNKRSSFSSPSSSSPVSASSKKPAQPSAPPPLDFSLAFSSCLHHNEAFLLGNANPGGAVGFLDILRSGNPAVGGMQGSALHYFDGGDGVMLPAVINFGGVSVGNNAIMAAETSNAGGDSGHGNCWNGFFNGFPHEIHDGV